MNRVQEQLLQRKIQKATDKNKKDKLLKSIWGRQKAVLAKKDEAQKQEAQGDAGLKKKMDFYDSVFKAESAEPTDPSEKPRKSSKTETQAEPETQAKPQQKKVSNGKPSVPGVSKKITKDDATKGHPAPEWKQKTTHIKKRNPEYRHKRDTRNAERKQKLDVRQKRFQKMNSKTDRGQPLMKNIMEDLYKKIKADKKAQKSEK